MASMRRLGVFAALVATMVVAAAAGCSPAEVAEDAPKPQSTEVAPQPQQSDAQPDPVKLPLSIPGVPFELEVRARPDADVMVVSAAEAHEQPPSHALAPLGQTVPGEDGLPGPSVRAILGDDSALAGLLQPVMYGQITDLAQVPTALGTIDVAGTFTAHDSLTTALEELPKSNPEGLYFEPQDFSVNGNWVLWREGSAGEKGALPTLDTDDWRIVAWDRGAGTVAEYASGYLLHNDRQAPRLSWSGAPTTDGGSIYFAAAIPSAMLNEGGDADWTESILRVPLGAPGDVELIGKGSVPAADPNGGVYWVAHNQSLIHDADTMIDVVTDGWSISDVAATPDKFFIAVVGDEGEDAWILMGNAESFAVEAALRSTSDWVALDAYGDTVVWGNGTANSDPAMYLWQSGDAAVQPLGSAQGMSVPLIGDTLVAVPQISGEGAVVWQLLRLES